MIGLNLNLLAPEQKDCLKMTKAFSYIKIISFIFLTFVVLISGLLLSARLILQDNLGDILVSSTNINEHNLGIDREITRLNNQIEAINKIQANYTKWSTVLAQLIKSIPNNIEINYLSFEKKTGDFTISGRARERQDLLNLKTILEQTPYLDKINSPISNLLTKNNVDFQFTGKLNTINQPANK